MRIGSALLVILILAVCAQSADALTKRSKKDECTVCHVLWREAFLTNEPTLLGPTQQNIVIAGSVGLSSSKGICYSCHDGYVKDSRNIIDLGNKHHQLRKVPDWLELPAKFRLDVNNEIYCGTCHGFHDVRGMGEIGSMPFMRLDNERSEMCMACHKDRTEELRYKNHPINVKSDIIPKETILKLGGKFGPDGEIICQTCHRPHMKPALIAPYKGSAICMLCHGDKKTVLQSDHNLSITFPALKNSKGDGIDDTGPCSMCHVPHNGSSKWMWARETGDGNPASQVCQSCHGKVLGIPVIGRYSHPVGKKLGKSTEFPLFGENGVKDEQGQVHCPSCHNVHRWNPGKTIQYTDRMEGGPTNSFLRKINVESGLCVTCHDEKEAVKGTDHDLRITVPDSANGESLAPEDSGPCGVCHIPHNAFGEKLWAREPIAGSPATSMCLACHGQGSVHIKKTVGQFSHPVDVYPKQGVAEKSGLPFFDQLGRREQNGMVQCATCHNPHQWTAGAPSPGHTENVEGDAASSFLRVPNNGQSKLCLQCHENKKQVMNTDHNLLGTAPEEKNLMVETPEQSGPCGACHIPHNAAGPRLWAKDLPGKKDYITRVCKSCHRKDGAARKKTINGNSHPVNVPIARINPGEEVLKQFPVYDSDGGKGPNGRVVCTTCHDPHTWSSQTGSEEVDGQPRNREGDASSSFLRKANATGSALCKTCHVEQTFVEGTPHDLRTSAPEEKNLLGQTPNESGPCGVCHQVHNSPNSLKMWGRKYGPVRRNENKMIALCTSCHTEGRVAEKKVQKIATHPEGIITTSQEGLLGLVYDDTQVKDKKENPFTHERYTPILITNILGYLSGRSYTPLFNNEGRKVNAGKISCPSCHNVHKWNLEQKINKEGVVEPKDLQGEKFLRIESNNLVCVECHGQDALYRYLYFHSAKSRAWSVKK